jgi:Helicase associated domain
MASKSSWYANLDILREFIETTGHIPHTRESHHGHAIGRWLYNQRRAFHQGTMPDHRRRYLEQQFPGILMDAPAPAQKTEGTRHEKWWNQCFSALLAFIVINERLPRPSEQYSEIHLGRWLQDQRKTHRAGTLLPARRKALLHAWPEIFDGHPSP